MKRLALALALFAALSCSTTSERAVQQDVKNGDLDGAAKKIAQRSADDPDDFRTRMESGKDYYSLARRAFDDGKQADFMGYLRKSQDECLAAAKLDPDDPSPHTWLGIVAAYQGDMNAADLAMRNALRLASMDPYQRGAPGFYYVNLAYISVYRGDLLKARRYLAKAQKRGVDPDELARVSILISWKANDMVEARDIFNGEAILSHGFTGTWDGEPLTKKMESFDDFAAVCCKNPSCGPNMEHACARERQAVARRDNDAETVQAQLEAERERRAKLKEIYDQHKELNIEIEKEPKPAASGDAQPAPATNPPATSSPAPAKTPAK